MTGSLPSWMESLQTSGLVLPAEHQEEEELSGAGYSQEDIDVLRNNDSAKDALRQEIRSDLRARGAIPGNSAGYCKVGREEIARGTQAGRLLKGN